MNIVAHNILAMNAGRQFNITSKDKAKSTEKLSSGYRINRAADDAAGLSISEKMRRQIRGLSQGVENTQAGVSLCQVADGALAEVSDMLHRITELSVQSANGTNSPSDRQAIQDEIGEILQEIDRIGETTTFNEHKIFQDDIGKTEQAGKTGNNIIKEQLVRDRIPIQISGQSTDNVSKEYMLLATDASLSINGDVVSWSDVKSNGKEIDLAHIEQGDYSFSYKGMDVVFTVDKDLTVDQLCEALSGLEWENNLVSSDKKRVAFDLSASKATGTGVAASYIVKGKTDGFYVNDVKYDWSNFKTRDGDAFDSNVLKAGSYFYSVDNVNYELKISQDNTAGWDDMMSLFTPKELTLSTQMQYSKSVTSIGGFSSAKITAMGSDYAKVCDSTYIKADNDGIYVKMGNSNTSKMTWDELGVDKGNPAEGTYHYKNSDGSVFFDFTVGKEATLEGIIAGLNNSKIKYSATGYLDSATANNTSPDNDIFKIIHFAPSANASSDNPIMTVTDSRGALRVWESNPAAEVTFNYVYGIADKKFCFEAWVNTSQISGYSMFYMTDYSKMKWNDYLSYRKQTGAYDADFVKNYYMDYEFQDQYGNKLSLSIVDTREDVLRGNGTAMDGVDIANDLKQNIKINGASSTYKYSMSSASVSSINAGNKNKGEIVTYLPNSMVVSVDQESGSDSFKLDITNIPQYSRKEIISVSDVDIHNNRLHSGLWIQSGCDTGDGICLEIDPMNTSILGIDDLNLSTIDGAYHAMDAVNTALEKLSANRSKIGAQQNRLEHTIDNENNIVENTTAAESRIRDTDMAEEMVSFSKSNILEQAGQAMLVQANQSNQGILSLLQ